MGSTWYCLLTNTTEPRALLSRLSASAPPSEWSPISAHSPRWTSTSSLRPRRTPRAPLKQQFAYSPTERVILALLQPVLHGLLGKHDREPAARAAMYVRDWFPLPSFAAFPEKRSMTAQVLDTDTGAVLDRPVLTEIPTGFTWCPTTPATSRSTSLITTSRWTPIPRRP